jgi:hypothetical protein
MPPSTQDSSSDLVDVSPVRQHLKLLPPIAFQAATQRNATQPAIRHTLRCPLLAAGARWLVAVQQQPARVAGRAAETRLHPYSSPHKTMQSVTKSSRTFKVFYELVFFLKTRSSDAVRWIYTDETSQDQESRNTTEGPHSKYYCQTRGACARICRFFTVK